MVPFTPARKDNMIAWMAARCDEPNYGKVLVFTFPKQKLVYGPQQIESRIDQDPGISQQLTLWGQGGSKVIRGTLLVIPVDIPCCTCSRSTSPPRSRGGCPSCARDRGVRQPHRHGARRSKRWRESSAAARHPRPRPRRHRLLPAAPPRRRPRPRRAERVLGERAWEAWTRSQEALRRGDVGRLRRRTEETGRRPPRAHRIAPLTRLVTRSRGTRSHTTHLASSRGATRPSPGVEGRTVVTAPNRA